MNIYRKLRSIKKKCSYFGIWNTVGLYGFGILKRLFKIEIKISVFYVKNITNQEIPLINLKKRRLDINDFRREEELYGEKEKWFNPKKMKIIDHRLNIEGIKAYGFFKDDNLVCSGWINFNPSALGKLKLTQEDAYLFDDYTPDRYRGNGYQLQMIDYRCFISSEKKRQRAWCNVYFYNRPSRNNYLRAGFIPAIRLLSVTFGKKKNIRKFRYIPNKVVKF